MVTVDDVLDDDAAGNGEAPVAAQVCVSCQRIRKRIKRIPQHEGSSV